MNTYQNLDGDSAVTHYQIGEDFITVLFNGSRPYTYSYLTAGSIAVEQMKELAYQGRGLNSYINRYQPGFVR